MQCNVMAPIELSKTCPPPRADKNNSGFYCIHTGVRGGAFGWGTAQHASRSRVWFPRVSLDFFIDIRKPSGRTMALGSTQPLTEMRTRNVSWGKGGRCIGLTILPLSCADCLEIWETQPPGTPGPVQACNGIALPLPYTYTHLYVWFHKLFLSAVILASYST
jgi:hypothetical protein